MFNFGRANKSQREAITSTEGPLLITAGPGTGKTFTLVQRIVYLIEELKVAPSEIFVTTFTNKAARELLTRIATELENRNITFNPAEMYIGTFHSLAFRILRDNLENTDFPIAARVLDESEKRYFLEKKVIPGFQESNDYDPPFWIAITGANNPTAYKIAKAAEPIISLLLSGEVDSNRIASDPLEIISQSGKLANYYQDYMRKNGLIDFDMIQTNLVKLFTENPQILNKYQHQFRYIMVDEYQDTNFIQEEITMMLGSFHKNICVVGDDDQSLYRFRGATIRNILEFESKFASQCKTVKLQENYRSTPGIVDFYNRWMDPDKNSGADFKWGKYRLNKTIIASALKEPKSPSVIKIHESQEPYVANTVEFIRALKESGQIDDYNQVAVLYKSISPSVSDLIQQLEDCGIGIYAPRAWLFFKREEVITALAALLRCFYDEQQFSSVFATNDYLRYTHSFSEYLQRYAGDPNSELAVFIKSMYSRYSNGNQKLPMAFSELLYRIYSVHPFKEWLQVGPDDDASQRRRAYNLAKLVELTVTYETINNLTVTGNSSQSHSDVVFDFFRRYLPNKLFSGVDEHEDERDYSPSGHVSVMTIHQSKGLEFPIVILLLPQDQKPTTSLLQKMTRVISAKYSRRPPFEPDELAPIFDEWRLFYTAFSRAESLLVLSEPAGINRIFEPALRDLPAWPNPDFNFKDFDFASVHPIDLKQSYAFTSDINLYEVCPRQYKFYKKFGFISRQVNQQLYGSLVHHTIQLIHRAALNGKESLITPENITNWVETTYSYLSALSNLNLGQGQIKAAKEAVLRYVEQHGPDWSDIFKAEVDTSLLRKNYILEGKVDLVRTDQQALRIVDFKASKRRNDDLAKAQAENYRRQLHLYAHLVSERTGLPISQISLYYTGEPAESAEVIFDYTPEDIEQTLLGIDRVVESIEHGDFNDMCQSAEVCNNCDFIFYCGKKKPL